MIVAKAFVVLLPCLLASSAPQCEDEVSLMQLGTSLKARTKQPMGVADRSLQAPPAGKEFSKFFNERKEGHGIHKWLQYFPAYQRHFQQFIGKEVHIMEIGIQSGGSLDMWKSVFGPKTHVYGMDINPDCKLYEDNSTKIFIGDQADPKFWAKVKRQVPKIDILIDDGGHSPDQQTGTLGMMLEHISPNGIYVTEDVHGPDNAFWQALKLNQLKSQIFHFTDLGRLVNSVHIYPFLLVLEKAGNSGKDAMFRQLGLESTADVPDQVKTVVTGPGPMNNCVQLTLKAIMPMGLDFLEAGDTKEGGCVPFVREDDDLSKPLMQMPPKGWLVAKQDNTELSDKWDDKSDLLLHKAITDFKLMHEGNCCDYNANLVQKSVDSLHLYPHLLIAQRTDETGKDRLVKAPQHGTSWIPYASAQQLAAAAAAAAAAPNVIKTEPLAPIGKAGPPIISAKQVD